MKRAKRICNDETKPAAATNPQNYSFERDLEAKCCSGNRVKILGILGVCLMGFSLLFSVSSVLKDPSFYGLFTIAEARLLDGKISTNDFGLADAIQKNIKGEAPQDELLGGLLPSGMDEKICLSRYQSVLYHHKKRTPQPSSYFISRIRRYEALHKQCGPYTDGYNKSMEQLINKSGGSTTNTTTTEDCKYVVWISFSGLGNRILTLASAFLYALLTDRVLLVDPGIDIPDLFCEPFPEASWLLPPDFPIADKFKDFDQKSPESYGNLLKKNHGLGDSIVSSYVYLHLVHDYDDQDKAFFCDQEQILLQKVSWLVMKTNNYFVPSLFLIPSFEEELNKLFPEKGAVFHHLGRYLLHPTNSVWGLITRYYEAYLARADEKIGIQIRVFDPDPGPFKHVLDQVLACVIQENLLPQINEKGPTISIISPKKPKTKAVLVTSLSSGYSEALRNMYWENPTLTREVIQVVQPTHEEHQQSDNRMHNRKAWAEMYLLSLTDKLVTSSWSTFGYVAQGLGGLKPWILLKAENRTAPDPACQRARSMEPCFHAPPHYDCKARRWSDNSKIVAHVQHCEDMSWGLRLVSED